MKAHLADLLVKPLFNYWRKYLLTIYSVRLWTLVLVWMVLVLSMTAASNLLAAILPLTSTKISSASVN
jgi:hypothetical protein